MGVLHTVASLLAGNHQEVSRKPRVSRNSRRTCRCLVAAGLRKGGVGATMASGTRRCVSRVNQPFMAPIIALCQAITPKH